MVDRGSKAMHEAATESAFERLYRDHHPAVLAYCARRGSLSDAWDAASEVFIVAWRRMDEVPAGDDERPWLLGVAYRVLANQRRGSQRRSRLLERAAAFGRSQPPWPEEQLIMSEAASEVLEALARLKPTDREILQLATWEELSPVEIAAALGISRAAVDQRYSRAKRRLARQLDQIAMTRKEPESEVGGVA